MKRPYFSLFGAVVCGILTAFFLLTFILARGPEDALVPAFAAIWAVLFGIPFVLFMARIIRFSDQQKQSRQWWERDDRKFD